MKACSTAGSKHAASTSRTRLNSPRLSRPHVVDTKVRIYYLYPLDVSTQQWEVGSRFTQSYGILLPRQVDGSRVVNQLQEFLALSRVELFSQAREKR